MELPMMWICFVFFYSGEDEEEQELCQDSQVAQEMLEEEVLRLLTREVLDLLSKQLFHPSIHLSACCLGA